jgi:pyruvate formate lyase activating enzyme
MGTYYINVNVTLLGDDDAMSVRGIIFDIKEFAVFDGPGIRTTVFFKGCPLRCAWCHNPEGLEYKPQLMVSYGSCRRCGSCVLACPARRSPPEETAPEDLHALCGCCGRCLVVCPLGLRRIAGTEYGALELAEKLLRNAGYLQANGGGFTLSGGEPAGQGEFLMELLGLLRGNHRAMETSGFCSAGIFSALLEELDLVMMDLKCIDGELHRTWTGQDNKPILKNLELLKRSGKPFIIRIPLIPGVNDTEKNLRETAELLKDSRGLLKVELLPYHKTAGAKYTMVNLKYRPGFDLDRVPAPDTAIFEGRGIPCTVL